MQHIIVPAPDQINGLHWLLLRHPTLKSQVKSLAFWPLPTDRCATRYDLNSLDRLEARCNTLVGHAVLAELPSLVLTLAEHIQSLHLPVIFDRDEDVPRIQQALDLSQHLSHLAVTTLAQDDDVLVHLPKSVRSLSIIRSSMQAFESVDLSNISTLNLTDCSNLFARLPSRLGLSLTVLRLFGGVMSQKVFWDLLSCSAKTLQELLIWNLHMRADPERFAELKSCPVLRFVSFDILSLSEDRINKNLPLGLKSLHMQDSRQTDFSCSSSLALSLRDLHIQNISISIQKGSQSQRLSDFVVSIFPLDG